MSKLLIIDTYGLIFRAYYAYPALTTSDGTPSGAIYGFITMLLKSIELIDPDHIVCSLESSTPTFRHELAADYKGNRKEADVDMKTQIGEVVNVLQSLGIPLLQKDGFEADDVIGSFAIQNQDKFDEIKIITGDRDLYQLISKNIRILMPGKTFSDFIEYDRERFETKYNISLDDFVLYKSLIGDASDNIKGIPGVGPKTAEKIVNQFHSMESILANLDQLPTRTADSIVEHQELWKKFYTLSKIECDIELPIRPEETKIEKLQIYKLRNIIERYELNSLRTRVGKFIDNFEKRYGGFGLFDDGEVETSGSKVSELRYFLSDNVEFPDGDKEKDANPVLEISKKAYVIYSEKFIRLGNSNEFIEVPENEIFNFIIKNNIREFVGFNLKPFIKILLQNGIEKIENYNFFDLELAWYLLKQDIKLASINDLVKNLNQDLYSDIENSTKDKIKDADIDALFMTEREVQKVLAHMEYTGVCCDTDHLKKLEDECKTKIAEIRKSIFDFVGFEFNPASTRDLGHVLFDVLKLPTQKKNKTGYSTDDATLTKLEGMSEIIPMIKNFRMYSKVLSTYVLGLQEAIGEDGKIHTTYSQAQVATGRLSSINPNLQNLPTSELGIKIRKAFVPSSKDKIFISFDYSQIELRVLAYESQDPELIKAFQNDEDIHTATAKIVFEKEEISKEERNFAKIINFGIVYGMEPYGLSQALKIDQKSAKEFIDKYFEKFKGVRLYFDRIKEQLDNVGYVNTFMNRKRYFNSWKASGGFQKKMLFREAINMPIQGGNSELIKIAMAKVFEYLRTNNLDGNLLLQIHDEMVLELHKDECTDKFKEDIQNIMCDAYDIGVPIKVSMKEGNDLSFS
jgi:DNA polymerase-1